ncbi:MAG: TVP38/TMEM64 family protein [Cyanobacteria bacterium CRU_2_1]|nr:TVP38/TMEM64 family protein [Cyanobacteria bacterium RU_5_0]NJR61434.1 TVP38/TMEM64 family protein [Cyanobacteria bacterium CRU_2_1]
MSRLIGLSRTRAFRLGLATLGIVLLCHWVPIDLLFDPEAFIKHIHMEKARGACIFVIAQVLATVLGIPGTVLVIAGGAIFGLMWGTIWSTVGATLGAIAAFYVARYLLRDRIEGWLGHHNTLKRLNRAVCSHSLSCVLAVRFAPISPFNLINFLFGLTPIGLKPYAIGTFLGIIPGTAAYTGLGASGRKIVHGEGILQLSIALCGLALLSIAPIVFKKLRQS